MLILTHEERMTAVTGPDFIALQVKDLPKSRSFYIDKLGLRAASFSPPGAVVFDTQPIPFALREPLVDLSASSRLGWGVSLWLAADDAQGLHDRLAKAGVPILQPPSRGPFGLQFSFADPDGYTVTIHQPKP
jgi:catechol 2,3-dioxygenase-like lactoylglutathione lyase family enzyme